MEVKLGHHDWRVLRRVARGKGKSVSGHELRMEMSRKTKDGTFLNALVDQGLLVVSVANADPFEAKYSLTDLGKQAAEHGVFEMDWETFKTRHA